MDVGGHKSVVLVIDSDNVRRGMLACTLPADSYQLEFAKTAESGLDRLGRLRPDVVIVGLDDSTIDLCQRIRLLAAGIDCVLMLMDERFQDTIGLAEAEAAGADAALAFPVDPLQFAQQVAQCQRSAAADHGTTSGAGLPAVGATTAARQPTSSDPWAGFRERVGSFHRRLTELDYYQLLGVPRGAPASEIKDAYYRRSMEFHPDRFVRLDDEDFKSRIYDVYKLMCEAFRVLIHPESRARYDLDDLAAPPGERSLRYREPDRWRSIAPESASIASTAAGRRYLHFADLAQQAGNLKSARMYLTLAVECEPKNAGLRRQLEAITEQMR